MQILINQPLKDYTSYKIGGNTPKLYIVETIEELQKVSDEDLRNAYILGGGTNILVSDEGVKKPVIKVDFKYISINHSDKILSVGSGLLLTEIVEKTAILGYEGLIHIAGIPGTIGGAIIMNASASHGAISDNLIDIEAYNKETKERKVFKKEECNFGFRQSIFQNSPWIVIFCRFQLKEGNKEELLKLYNEIINYREKNYPLSFPSAGCWFKKDWGGKEIIKKIGMSGAIKGKAVVSPMFSGFILNIGGATAKDIYSLVSEIQDKSKEINEDMPCEIITWGKI